MGSGGPPTPHLNLMIKERLRNLPAEAATDSDSLDGMTPFCIIRPTEVAEIQEAVRLAVEEKRGIIIRGAGTHMNLGRPPESAEIVLDMSRFDKVLEYDAVNMRLTCQAGVTLGAIDQMLKSHGQMLPLDPPLKERRTAGGLIATNMNGPRRLGYGPIRDNVTGIRAVTGRGDFIRFGTKVVKDVAGYNVAKLFIGSLGTLGVITEAIFKLYAIPEEERGLIGFFKDGEGTAQAARQLLASPLMPKALEVMEGEALSLLSLSLDRYWAIIVLFDGLLEEVERQVRQAREIFMRAGAQETHALRGEENGRLWQGIRDLSRAEAYEENRVVIRAATLISHSSSMVERLKGMAERAGVRGVAWAHAGSGIAYLMASSPSPGGRAALMRLVREVQGMGGTVLESAPLEIRREVCPWGNPPTSLGLMRRIKRAFDPAGILNPGRFVGGI